MAKPAPPKPEPQKVGTSLAELFAAKGFSASPAPAVSSASAGGSSAGGAPTANAASTLDLSTAGKLVSRREKKGRGGKTVTLVQGLGEAQAALVCSALKKALGCGATVEEGEVVLQGDHVDRAADWLTARGAKRVSRSG